MSSTHNYSFDKGGGFFCDGTPITSFDISIIEKITRKKTAIKSEQTLYLVRVTYTDGRPPVSKWIEKPKKIDYFEDFEINDSFMSAKIRTLLHDKMLSEIEQLPAKVIIEIRPGLNFVDGSPVYAIGEHIIPKNDAKITEQLEVGIKQTLLRVPSVSTKSLREKLDKYIKLLPGITEPLFFYSLFAVVKPFIERLQIHCSFLLALIAPSGQLKTTLARLYGDWFSPAGTLEIPIYSNKRTKSILDWIGAMSGLNILIDDLRKSNNTNDQKRQEAKLDAISRHIDFTYGCANVILTGETMENMGIFSCLDRIFPIHMPVMNARQVRELQENLTALGDNLMPEIALQFVQSLMANYDEVLKDIQSFYDRNCHRTSMTADYATRTNRHTMFIRLTAFLFGKYFYHGSSDYEKSLEAALENQSIKQEKELMDKRFRETHHDYIADLFHIVNGGKHIKASNSKEDYISSNDTFLTYDGKLYITSSALTTAFFSFYGRFVSKKEIVKQLHDNGILEEEPNAKGFQKNLGGRKSYVINIKLWVSYLVKNDYPVTDKMRKKYLP